MAETWISKLKDICTCTTCTNDLLVNTPVHVIIVSLLVISLGFLLLAYLFVFIVAPVPRKPFPEEKEYRTLSRDGLITGPYRLPCWQDALDAEKKKKKKKKKDIQDPDRERARARRERGVVLDRDRDHVTMEPPDLFMSVVVPAYNEEDRLGGMLEEAVDYLEHAYGAMARREEEVVVKEEKQTTGKTFRQRKQQQQQRLDKEEDYDPMNMEKLLKNSTKINNNNNNNNGWEIIIVSDGSCDKTEEAAFNFARDHQLSLHPRGYVGPWTPESHEGVHIPPGTIRVVSLSKNRGKGGAVTHGMRHVRGQYVVFADADGASKFDGLEKLVAACLGNADSDGRAVAVGSRAHMVGSEAVVNRSKLRNFLMHSFHLILWLLTPRNTATIKDTQCGFKLFSRSSLPYIIPYMHSEGWIFDVEMLMLAEFARIPVVEVPVTWREVKGSKLNVIRDSVGMAWGLTILRAAWSLGIYRRS